MSSPSRSSSGLSNAVVLSRERRPVPFRDEVGEHRHVVAPVPCRNREREGIAHCGADRIHDPERQREACEIRHVLRGVGEGEAVRVAVALDHILPEGLVEGAVHAPVGNDGVEHAGREAALAPTVSASE